MNPYSAPTAASAVAPESQPISEAKRLAHIANSQQDEPAVFSEAKIKRVPGSTSPEGKAKSSLNALKTGLTGRTVLLPTEDAAAYQQHVSDYEKELRPVGQRECDLVQSIADASWRLQRIPVLESAIYAHGRIQFADQFNDQDPAFRSSFIDLHTHLAYEKQLRNLQLQESRLHRRREKDLAELRQAQSDRRNRDTNQLEAASRLLMQAKRANKSFDPHSHGPAFLNEVNTQLGVGFEFSLADIEAYSSGRAVLDIAYAAFRRAPSARNQLQIAA